MVGTRKMPDVLSRSFVCALSALVLLGLFGCGGSDGGPTSSFSIVEDPGTDAGIPTNPETDQTRALGFYTNGSLSNGVQLPDASFAHIKIFRLRDRAWGTRTLVDAIVQGSAAFRRLFPFGDRVQIGDLGKEKGGYASGHASHQNGLDVDVGYLQTDHVERNPDTSGPNGFTEVFVKSGKVTANFDVTRNWHLLKSLVQRNVVGRIFVDPAIKNTFCAKSSEIDPAAPSSLRTEVLRRLRPYANHADHFHMRVKCPAYATKCISQEEPPKGSGCSSMAEASEAEHVPDNEDV